MNLKFVQQEAIDPDSLRWAERRVEQGAKIDGGPARDTTRFKRARERYVVADTPTLEMNAAMRSGQPLDAATKQMIGLTNHLTEGVLAEDAVLSRSTELLVKDAIELFPGQVVEQKGFMSTQAMHNTPYDRRYEDPGKIHVEWTIRAPKGVHAGDVGYDEIVLRPGDLTVVSSEWDPVKGVLRVVADYSEAAKKVKAVTGSAVVQSDKLWHMKSAALFSEQEIYLQKVDDKNPAARVMYDFWKGERIGDYGQVTLVRTSPQDSSEVEYA